MALLGHVGNRYDPAPASMEPGRPRAAVIARVVNALSALTDLLQELTEDEAMAAYRVAKLRATQAGEKDDLESES